MNKIHIDNTIEVLVTKGVQYTGDIKNRNADPGNERGEMRKEGSGKTGIPPPEIAAAIEWLCVQKKAGVQEFADWDLCTLLEYISGTHHQLIRENAVVIYDLAQKLAYRHSDVHPELTAFVTALFFFLHNLLNHLKREEQILFPTIKQLLKDNSQGEKGQYTTFGIIKEWVLLMEKEHQSSCKSLKLLNELTNNFSIPSDASDAYRSLFTRMQEFETGLLLLMSIESTFLFPKALAVDGEQG